MALCPATNLSSAASQLSGKNMHASLGDSQQPPIGITFLAGLDRDLRAGLAAEIRALWTHHSTAIEGNSLTLGDTAFVLQEGLTVSGKPLKDHQEVVGHARAIDLVYAIIDKCRTVTADDLHALHRSVQTEVVVDIYNPVGRWKVESNGTTALLTSGRQQWHDYSQPNHIPALMNAWLNRLDEIRHSGGNLINAYTEIHLGFTAIHPYADGNGRMARLLANLPVIAGGDPPVLIPVERLRDYITLMGDWSIARGAPKPGELLVPEILEVERMRAFFEEVSRPAKILVDSYKITQSSRANNH
jgi:fido (protein-threonine AMPylation protein)